ncbi:hypothetical protein G6F40_015023 [Rhizopus arrhizus]|nr:hypothetical protein G6F40_015023 [Rhizopus arrhizus]
MAASTAIEYSCAFCHVNVFTWHYPMIGAHRSASAIERRFRRGSGFDWNGLPEPRETRPTNLGQAVARMSPDPSHEAIATDVTRI